MYVQFLRDRSFFAKKKYITYVECEIYTEYSFASSTFCNYRLILNQVRHIRCEAGRNHICST